MKTVHRSVLIWYSAQEMFKLVTDIAQYPKFLPWCDHALVLEHDDLGMKAEIGISFAGVRQSFVTRNDHVPGRKVTMKLVDGPFSSLDGRWNFSPVGSAGQRALTGDQIYRAISQGSGVMYGFADRVPAPDRWAIAAYVQALRRSGTP